MEKEATGEAMTRMDFPTPVTGVIGTVLGGIGTAAALAAGGAGLMGGNRQNGPSPLMQENANLRSENSVLKANVYTDSRITGLIEQTAANTASINALKESTALQMQLAKKDAEVAVLQSEGRLNQNINAVATAGVQTASAVAYLQRTVSDLIQVGVPAGHIIPPAPPFPPFPFPFPVPPAGTTTTATESTTTTGN